MLSLPTIKFLTGQFITMICKHFCYAISHILFISAVLHHSRNWRPPICLLAAIHIQSTPDKTYWFQLSPQLRATTKYNP